MEVSITITGDDEIIKRLQALPERLQRLVVRPAARAAAEPILHLARSLCPVDTGALVASLHIETFANKKTGIGARVATGKRSELGIDPKDKYYYPAVLEFGGRVRGWGRFGKFTKMFKMKKSGVNDQINAHPFLRPALYGAEDEAMEIFREKMREGLDEIATTFAAGEAGGMDALKSAMTISRMAEFAEEFGESEIAAAV